MMLLMQSMRLLNSSNILVWEHHSPKSKQNMTLSTRDFLITHHIPNSYKYIILIIIKPVIAALTELATHGVNQKALTKIA